MRKAFGSVQGFGILLTLIVIVYLNYYFIGSGWFGVNQVDAKYFGVNNFTYWFAYWSNAYLTLIALISCLALSSSSGSTGGRIVALLNIGSSGALFVLLLVIQSKGWVTDPMKLEHLRMCLVMSIEDCVLSIAIPVLLSLGMRNINVSGS